MIYLVNLTGDSAWAYRDSFVDHQTTELFSDDLVFLQNKGQVDIYYHGQIIDFQSAKFVYIKSNHYDEDSVCLLTNVLNFWQVPFNDLINTRSQAITDKSLQSIILPLIHEIPFPKTMVLYQSRIDDYQELISNQFGNEYVVKASGSKGQFVTLVDETQSLTQAVDRVINETNAHKYVLIQEKINKQCDFRCLIVNQQILVMYKRCSDKLTTNISNGGTFSVIDEPSDIQEKIKEVSKRAASAMQYDVAGVDIVLDKQKPLILEVNKNPGCTQMEDKVIEDFARLLLE